MESGSSKACGFSATLLIAACLLSLLLSTNSIVRAYGTGGDDFKVFCAASTALSNQENPYVVAILRHYEDVHLSFVYPAVSAKFLGSLCGVWYQSKYYLFWLLLLLSSCALLRTSIPPKALALESRLGRLAERVFLVSMVFGAFTAPYWNFLTGNLGIVEFSAMVVVYVGLSRGTFMLPGMLLGFMAWLKLYPILFLLAALGIATTFLNRFIFIFSGVLTFLVLSLLNYLYSPGLFGFYVRQIMGQIPGQHSPISENGWTHNASSLHLFTELIPDETSTLLGLNLGYLVFSLIVLLAMTCSLRFRRPQRDLRMFSLLQLAIILLLPRFKTYALSTAVPALLQLTQNTGYIFRAALVMVVTILPHVVLASENTPLGDQLLMRYWTFLSLAATFALLFSNLMFELRAAKSQTKQTAHDRQS